MGGRLVGVLHSRPTGSGAITRRRVEGAGAALGCHSFEIVNLYAAELPTSGSLDAATSCMAWAEGRSEIERAVHSSDTRAVLLGYGVRCPAGPQRTPYREQLQWLTALVSSSGHAPWTYEDRPSRPSRWQRIAHRQRPGSSVHDLASELLQQHETGGLPLGAGKAAIWSFGARHGHVHKSEPPFRGAMTFSSFPRRSPVSPVAGEAPEMAS